MSKAQSSLPPTSGGSGIRPSVRRLALPGRRSSARWATVAAAIAVSAVAAGCSASPASSGHSAAGLTAVQGRSSSSAAESIKALGISLYSAGGVAAVGSAGAPAVATTVSATALSTLTYTSTGTDGGLYKPQGVSADDGTVYASNTGENVVAASRTAAPRRVAGSLYGVGEHGDGGQATAASLYHPGGTAEDAKGDIFIADSGDNVVREVTPAGVIRRIAGTGIAGLGYAGPSGFPATLSQLDHPQNVAVERRTATCSSPTPTTTGSQGHPARDRSPPSPATASPAIPGDGRLAAFAELNQPDRPRRRRARATCTSPTPPTTSSAAWTPRPASSPPSPATTPPTRPTTAWAGSRRRRPRHQRRSCNDPQGVAIDGAGDLFIADTFNNAIREVTPAGTISTVVNAAAAAAAPAAWRREQRRRPDRLQAEHPLRGRDRPEHRRPVHRRHRQQQDRRGHRPGPATASTGRPDRPGPAPDAPATRRRRDSHD